MRKTQGTWFVEGNQTGVLARVYGVGYSGLEFLVAFEYVARCDPIFSMLDLRKRDLGKPLSQFALPPNQVFLVIDGVSHTWHGAEAEYQNGTEVGVGITREAWNSLLMSPKSVTFIARDGRQYSVPVKSLSAALTSGAEQCLRRFR